MDQIVSYIQGSEGLFKGLMAIVILIVGYFLAGLVSKLIVKGLKSLKIDNYLKNSKLSLAAFIGKIIFYLLMIIVLMVVLEMLGVSQVLKPLQDMVNKFLNHVPNVVVSFVIGYIGYFLATIVSELIETIGDAIDGWEKKLKLPENIKLVVVLKKIIFITIFIPVLIVALDTLQIKVISDPAKSMLHQFINAIPSVIYATIIILVAVILGKFLMGLLRDILNGLQVNNLKEKLFLNSIIGKTNVEDLICNLLYFLIIYFALIEALNQLGLTKISTLLVDLFHIIGKVGFGLIVLAIGNAVAKFAYDIYMKGESANSMVGSIIKASIIVIFLAMGLTTMGIANDIINLAFGLSLGAIAVAFALSFGLGGREAAGKELENFFRKFKN